MSARSALALAALDAARTRARAPTATASWIALLPSITITYRDTRIRSTGPVSMIAINTSAQLAVITRQHHAQRRAPQQHQREPAERRPSPVMGRKDPAVDNVRRVPGGHRETNRAHKEHRDAHQTQETPIRAGAVGAGCAHRSR